MEYTVLGKTGLTVSRVGYGGATAGLKNYLEAYDPSNENDRRGIVESIETALAVGINYYNVKSLACCMVLCVVYVKGVK